MANIIIEVCVAVVVRAFLIGNMMSGRSARGVQCGQIHNVRVRGWSGAGYEQSQHYTFAALRRPPRAFVNNVPVHVK